MKVEQILTGMVEAYSERDVVVEIEGKQYAITKMRVFELREGMKEHRAPNLFERLLGAKKDPETGQPLYREDRSKPIVLEAEPIKRGLILL